MKTRYQGVQGMRYPSKYDKGSYHSAYGVINWLVRIGVKNQEFQNQLINDFLKDNGFVENEKLGRKKKHAAKFNFIDNRFQLFMQYVMKNTEPAI